MAEAVTEAALSGMGIARKCRWEVAEHLEDGNLTEVLSEHTVLSEWGIFAVRSPSRNPTPRARALTDFIAGKFKEIETIRPKFG